MNDVAANRSASAQKSATWHAAIGVGALIAVSFIGTTLVTPLYVLYRQVFGFSEVTLTLIYAVYVVGNLTALLLFGRLSDQIGRRRTALPAIGVGILSTLVFLFAQDTAWLFVARMLSGFAIGIASGTGTAWLAELQGGRDKSRATLMAAGANMVGLSIGAMLAGCLAQYAPWPLRLVFAIYVAMLVALLFVIRRLVLLVFAQSLASMPVLLIGTALSGTAAALGYRGSLQVVNEIAPSDRRAEVISTYLICCYVGNSVPVIGVGVLEALSTPIVASSVFAITIALLAVVALFTGRNVDRVA